MSSDFKHEEHHHGDGPTPNYSVFGAVIIAAIIISVAIVYSFGGKTGENSGGGGKEKTAVELGIDDDAILGDKNAPITVLEFSDFQCPYCEKFFKTVKPTLTENYVKTGQVNFVYRDFAFLGKESLWAGEASQCANDQGKYWDYHDKLFNSQNGENVGTFSKENLKKFAGELGLNAEQFNSCLDSDKHKDEVEKDTQDGQDAGLSGTPSVFIGKFPMTVNAALVEEKSKNNEFIIDLGTGTLVIGAQPLSVYETVIKQEMARIR